MIEYTAHAIARSQQRSIPPLIVDWLMDYGRVTRHKGGDVYHFDKAARRTLRSRIGGLPYKRLADQLDVYVVISDDGKVITVGNRFKHLKK